VRANGEGRGVGKRKSTPYTSIHPRREGEMRSPTFRNRSITVLIVALLVLALAAPALALVSESGYKYCNGYIPYSRAYSTGTTEHFPPGSGYGIYYNGSSWKVTTQWSSSGDGFWFVQTNGSLNDPGTYAVCSQYPY